MNTNKIESVLNELETLENQIKGHQNIHKQEVKQHTNIYRYLLAHIEQTPLFQENTAKAIHTLLSNPSVEYTEHLVLDTYRTVNIAPVTSNHITPSWEEVPHFMEHYLNQINTSKGIFSPIEYAVLCHKRFLDICPFSNFNLQTSYYILNYFLLSEQKICFLPPNKKTYLNALTKAQHPTSPNTELLLQYISDNCLDISISFK